MMENNVECRDLIVRECVEHKCDERVAPGM